MKRRITDIDEETGEVIKQSESTFVIFDNEKGYLFRSKNHYRKSFSDIKLSSFIRDRSDFLRVHLLAEHIYKDTNTIAIRINNKKVRIADTEDISLIIDLSIKKTKEFLNRMKKIHVIAERIDAVGNIVSVKYVLNPLFFNSNKYLSADLYFLFQESLDKYLPLRITEKFHEFRNIKHT